jgi:L-asparaginase II
MSSNPVLVEVWRGDAAESRHRGAVAVADSSGRLVAAWGDTSRPVHPRSALKPVQALPLVETGAASRFGLGAEELALAAASHSGTPEHTGRVAAWLGRLGLSAADLECGAQPPKDAATAAALAAAGAEPSPLHNNCSGKHAGFLTVARALGLPTAGYVRRDHPVQALVAESIAALTGCALAEAPCGLDGCGIPAFAVPLAGLAAAMARLAAPAGLDPARREAAAAIVASMRAHPHLVAGPGRPCSEIMAAAPGLVVKIGAEGVYVAILPAAGLGVAVKIDDGAARAAEVALLATLDRLGLLDDAERQALAPRLRPPVLTVAGLVAGEVRAVLPG